MKPVQRTNIHLYITKHSDSKKIMLKLWNIIKHNATIFLSLILDKFKLDPNLFWFADFWFRKPWFWVGFELEKTMVWVCLYYLMQYWELSIRWLTWQGWRYISIELQITYSPSPTMAVIKAVWSWKTVFQANITVTLSSQTKFPTTFFLGEFGLWGLFSKWRVGNDYIDCFKLLHFEIHLHV